MSIESEMLSNHLIFYFLFLLWASVFPRIRVFSNDSALCIRWPKYCSFSISPSNEYSGLISFRIHWFDLLAVQGTLKSLLEKHNSKVSVQVVFQDSARVLDAKLLETSSCSCSHFMFNLRMFPLAKNALSRLRGEQKL